MRAEIVAPECFCSGPCTSWVGVTAGGRDGSDGRSASATSSAIPANLNHVALQVNHPPHASLSNPFPRSDSLSRPKPCAGLARRLAQTYFRTFVQAPTPLHYSQASSDSSGKRPYRRPVRVEPPHARCQLSLSLSLRVVRSTSADPAVHCFCRCRHASAQIAGIALSTRAAERTSPPASAIAPKLCYYWQPQPIRVCLRPERGPDLC